jgi:hypothetical protein
VILPSGFLFPVSAHCSSQRYLLVVLHMGVSLASCLPTRLSPFSAFFVVSPQVFGPAPSVQSLWFVDVAAAPGSPSSSRTIADFGPRVPVCPALVQCPVETRLEL